VPESQSEEVDATHRSSIETYLNRILHNIHNQQVNARAIVTGTESASTIINVSLDEEVDLIMMTTRGFSGLEHFMLGSVADRVVQHTTVPVFLFPSR
jgi:nucleotide-binding universal stress UspA family protein